MTSMRIVRRLLPLPVLLATLALAPTVWADVPPPQTCDPDGPYDDPSIVGTACEVAGPNADEPGICVSSTCGTEKKDGGPADAGQPVGYTCYLCQVVDDAGPTSSGNGSSGKGSGGCSMSPFQREGTVGTAMLGLGLFAFAWGRRKNRR